MKHLAILNGFSMPEHSYDTHISSGKRMVIYIYRGPFFRKGKVSEFLFDLSIYIYIIVEEGIHFIYKDYDIIIFFYIIPTYNI